jgi:hypothetical protein
MVPISSKLSITRLDVRLHGTSESGCGSSIQRPCHSRDCRTDAQDLHRFPTALEPTSDNLTRLDDSLVPCKRTSNRVIDNLEETRRVSSLFSLFWQHLLL